MQISCTLYMNRHWSYPFIAMKCNTFPGTRLGFVFCSCLVFQAVRHFEHLDADYSLALSLTLDAYLYLFFLQKLVTSIRCLLKNSTRPGLWVACLECSSTALPLWKPHSGPVVLHPSHTRVNWWNPTAEHHPSLSHPCLLQPTHGT